MAISASPTGTPKSRSKAGKGRLALEMTPEAIGLYHEGEAGDWVEIGHAQPESDSFPKQIEWLRVEALARLGRQAPITIWLPDDQVLRKSTRITESGTATRRNLAADLMERETSYKRTEIEVAVSPRRPDGDADCLAILRQTREEAEGYARKWGFEPGQVTVRDAGPRFSSFADFGVADGSGQRAARKGARWGAITAGVAFAGTAAAVAVWGVATLMQVSPSEPIESTHTGPAPMFASLEDPASPGAAPMAPRPATGTAQGLAWPAILAEQPELKSPYLPGWLAAFEAPGAAPPPVYVNVDDHLTLGRAPQSTRLPLQLAALGPVPAGFLVEAREAEVAALPDPVTSAPAPMALTADPYAGNATVLASLVTLADAPLSAPLPIARATGADQDKPEAVEVTVWTKASGIPQPILRPDVPEWATDLVQDVAKTDGIEEAIAALPKPDETGQSDLVASAEADAPLPAPKATDDAEVLEAAATDLAVVPQPAPRPSDLETRVATVRALVPRSVNLEGPVSRSVSRAAKRQGIPLDRISLIGIINVGADRQALLRLPNGRFRRIGKGDALDGWEVALIGRDAVRLEQGDETHTLILVNR